MAISSTDLALLSARLGVARLGASRLAFIPYDVEGALSDEAGEYVWHEIVPPAANVWTLVCDSWICVQSQKVAFAEEEPAVTASIEGFTSVGEGGYQDGTDVSLYLASDTSTAIDTTVSSGGGAYTFSGLADGDYYVRGIAGIYGGSLAVTISGGVSMTNQVISLVTPESPAWPPV